eukprot:CAMPEP_0168348366 /NCGR_PEP_ID=MMETSP0213-20121227/19672_1 /TAXON_ID=151035 /ORGANISM="Euplotes harpa, Strain FSP1.4" /LENGTH=177 /DNA_ID=CAMNT_0008357891 /DNA_START=128 /DNA_END=658 /DNA_ORIENTATION=+
MGKDTGLLRGLETRLEFGIEDTPEKLAERKRHFGENTKRKVKIRTVCEMVCEVFEDKILRILLCAALVSLIIGIWQEGLEKGWIEGITIYVAVVIITIVTVTNNYTKEKQFQKLMDAREDKYCSIIRNGKDLHSSIYDLLVGDIVQIREGDSVPADVVLLKGAKVTTDESNITGEPE